MSLRGVPLRVTIFILGLDTFTEELKYYIRELSERAEGSLREDSKIILINANELKIYYNQISSQVGIPYYSMIGSDNAEVRYNLSKLIVQPHMNYRHHTVVVNNAVLKSGSIIFPGVVIGPGASLGEHVLCQANSVIGANVQIGACSVVSHGVIIEPGVKIGDRVHIGSGAIIKEKLFIGNGIKVAPGEVVTQNILGGSYGT
jgi:acetyltransferase-like isoleucine patch superfamily enzyme